MDTEQLLLHEQQVTLPAVWQRQTTQLGACPAHDCELNATLSSPSCQHATTNYTPPNFAHYSSRSKQNQKHAQNEWLAFNCASVILRANCNADVGAKNNSRMEPLVCVKHNYTNIHITFYVNKTRLTASFPGQPGYTSSRKVKQVWI